MESEAAEVSPNPSTKANPGNRLKSVLSKTRRDRNKNASKVSVTGAEDSSEGNGTGVRNSIDSSIDKSRQSSLDDGSSRVKLAKLIPGHKKRKKKRQEATELAEEQDLEEEGRGRRTSEQPATAASLSTAAVNRSHSTLGDEASSLITVDSDAESPLGSPPPLLSRQSHIGYLTASSPLIKTSNTADPSDTDGPAIDEAATSLQKSSTIPWDNQIPETSNLAPRHAATLGTEQAERSPTRSRSRDGRGISPGTKFKDVFSTGSRKKDARSTESPDRESTMSNGSGNGLSAMFKNEKRNSMSFRKGSKPSDINSNASYSQQSLRSPNQSIQSLPAIVTSSPKSFTSTVSEAPVLTTTPPTPTEARPDGQKSPTKKSSSAGTNANTVTSASGNMISHRRIRSDSATHAPSKLSNAMSAPLTPTVEEVRTPGGRTPAASGSPGGAGGFFSSVFTAAQNAASTFTNTIANNPPRPRSSAQNTDEGSGETITPSNTNTDSESQSVDEKKPLAIDTLGSGDLSLSHLGIASDTPATANSTGTFPLVDENSVHRDEAAARVEDASAARAVSAAYSEVADDLTPTPVAEDNASVVRPRSFTEKTTPNGSVLENEPGSAFKRSGSVRSRVGAVTRRKRTSSAATAGTGNTIAAGIGAGHSALTNPAASASTQKLSGFNVANKKRNRDFHQLFRSVPDDDYLIEDYSCALQREIILAGRIYVSEGHICFSSNILGWVTTLIISFDEVVSVEKENTAMIIPNAIAIQTLHARHTFRSLLSREATYDLIIGLWKLIHPNLKSTLNGAKLDAGDTGDKTEKADPSASDDGSEISEEEEEGNADEEDDDEADGSVIDAADGEAPTSEAGDPVQKTASRKASAMGVGIGQAAGGVPTLSDGKAGEKAAAAATAASVDFPGPATHAPTECGDADTHYEKVLKDDVVPAPLGKVFSMTFGPASGGFMSKWLLDEMKVMDLQMEDDKKGLSEENKSRTYSYIKPLYASIGPKQTKCIVTETLDAMDLEKAVSITSSTQTPDVPSGNVFIVKTRCCLMWASGNSTRILMSCTIEWSGKSWLKGPIEKGANDGQSTHANDLVKALKAGVTSRARAGTVGSKAKTKGKRAKGGVEVSKKTEGEKATSSSAQAQADSWGLFEPLHGLLGPIVDIFKPFVSANMVIGILLLFIIISWFRGPTTPAKGQVGFSLSSPERIAAYEEIWRKEESDLWDWLEQRIGMDGIAYPSSSRNLDREAVKKARTVREKSIKGHNKQARLALGSMKKREVDHAIRVTEERLKDLKEGVQRKREENTGKKPPPLAQDLEEAVGEGEEARIQPEPL